MKCPPQAKSRFHRMAAFWLDRALVLKAITFASIGCVNTAMDFAVFSIGYFYFGLPIVVANLASWSIVVTNSFVLNSMITFAAESGRRLTRKRFVKFATAQVGGLLVNTSTVLVASFFIPVLFAKGLAVGASFLVNFTLSNFVVFRLREALKPHS